MKSGQIYVFAGNGKGKTSAALGTTIRALAQNWQVVWLAFYKSTQWQTAELQLSNLLADQLRNKLEIYAYGQGFYLPGSSKQAPVGSGSAVVVDTATTTTHQQSAVHTLQQAQAVLHRSHPPQLLVLDEILNAITDKLITEAAVLDLLQKRGATHCVLTGRQAAPALLDAADLVSSIEKVKHPYDHGQLAMPGLDF